MKSLRWPLALSWTGLCALALLLPAASGGPQPHTYWEVDDVRPGMKGEGRTVMKGTRIEPFAAEVLGVLKNTSPGRDLILCRLSGLDLEKTGIIAGMSGSPITIDGKLLGAVAYAWAFGKEPIAGVTPFSQMHSYVEAYERRDLAEKAKPTRVGLRTPVLLDGQRYDTVTVSDRHDDPVPTASDGLWLVPLRTPLAATGFTSHSLSLLRDHCRVNGLVPVQGGGVSAAVAEQEKDTPLRPGGPMAVAMVTGDFDLSGIGTVTHIEGDRVYGFGHPFFGIGTCEFPLMTGIIHTVYPRQSISFKMGSPLRTVGVVNADVSTCVAGWLHRKPDMIPVRMTVCRKPEGATRTFNVEIARQRSLLSTLVFSSLINSVDMEGELPDELSAELRATIEVEGQPPIVINDTFSGPSYSGGRAPAALYQQVTSVINLLTFNTFQQIRINRIECETTIQPGRQTADIESVELDSETYAPGETLKANVFVRPYKGPRQRVPVTLRLPADLPEGSYQVTVCDDLANARQELRDNPLLTSPQNLDQVFEALQVHTAAKRTNVALRVPAPGVGVALGGKALPNLPGSMVQILGNTRRTGAQSLGGALIARQTTPWVVQGSETVRFTVAKNKRITAEQ